MNIREAARQASLPVKTVRYYDDIDLVKAARGANGYRNYADGHVHKLRFLQRARGLGFSIEDCRHLLSLYGDDKRASADVKRLALSHLKEVDRKLDELNSLRRTLSKLIESCSGDSRPDCPILDHFRD
jgi:Cu(I)-responsive transcriptional regulator